MTVDLIPDVERIVYTHLADEAAVQALETEIMGRTPKDTTGSWVKVTQLDARRVAGNLEHVISAMVQLEVYAAGQEAAWLHARTIRAALAGMEGQTVADATVTAVDFPGMARIPDPELPKRERVILTTAITVHP